MLLHGLASVPAFLMLAVHEPAWDREPEELRTAGTAGIINISPAFESDDSICLLIVVL